MRRHGPPSEIGRLAAPLAGALDAAWQRMHWWVAAMVVLYALSGITVVRADEVAVVLRWGHLVGDTPALQEHGPGLLFGFPRPIDRVVRVPVKHVSEMAVETLASENGDSEETGATTLNPLRQGYALTGDQNIVHVRMEVRYRVRDAAEWAFYGPRSEDALLVEITAAMVRSLGEMGVDRALSDGRKDLIATATRRAQAGLDAAHAGLELSSVELTKLAPPSALARDFDAVQSAYIGAETMRKDAQAYAATVVPEAQAGANSLLQSARGDLDTAISAAHGEADAFCALDREYRANPLVVRERMYRDAVERAIGSAGSIKWVPPPPAGGRYNGFRITLAAPPVGSGRSASDDDDER